MKTKKKTVVKQSDPTDLFSTYCGMVLSSDPAPLRIIFRQKTEVIHVISGEEDVMMHIGTNHQMMDEIPAHLDDNIRDIGRVLEKIGKIMQKEGSQCLTHED